MAVGSWALWSARLMKGSIVSPVSYFYQLLGNFERLEPRVSSSRVNVLSQKSGFLSLVRGFTSADTDPRTGTISPMFFFPDGGVVLEGIDRILAGFKCLSPMGRTHRN